MFRFSSRCLASKATINPRTVEAEYAVRGAIAIRAGQIEADLKAGGDKAKSYTFDTVVKCNIGNPQALDQKPLSFPRQVLALMASPQLLEHPDVGKLFNKDAIERAQSFISGMGGWKTSGGYTASKGYDFIRKSVATFIENRDGGVAKVDPESIYLTNGTSSAVTIMVQMLLGGKDDGLMIPIPQYPLYTALITLCDGVAMPYYLDEQAGWGCTAEELAKAAKAPTGNPSVKPRALVVINPGNPTGQILDRPTMENMIKLCHTEDLVLLADEVYQDNNYTEGAKEFLSFRKVLLEMGTPYSDSVQLASFHSTSKGRIGECGRRGGYMQLSNFPTEVSDIVLKMSSIALCGNVDGQVMVDLMVNPPTGESKALHEEELETIQQSLLRRAKLLTKELNNMKGIKATPVEGAMYVYPSLEFPIKFVEAAVAEGYNIDTVDAYWCMLLLEKTGIVVVPGSGFGQKPGTQHFRITILPPESAMESVVTRLNQFQEDLFSKYDSSQ